MENKQFLLRDNAPAHRAVLVMDFSLCTLQSLPTKTATQDPAVHTKITFSVLSTFITSAVMWAHTNYRINLGSQRCHVQPPA